MNKRYSVIRMQRPLRPPPPLRPYPHVKKSTSSAKWENWQYKQVCVPSVYCTYLDLHLHLFLYHPFYLYIFFYLHLLQPPLPIEIEP
jgi:hypothetical protein